MFGHFRNRTGKGLRLHREAEQEHKNPETYHMLRDSQKNIIKVSQNKAFLFTSRLFYLKCPDVYNIFPLNKEEDVHQGNIAKIFDTYPKKDVSFSENICKIACLNDHEKVYQDTSDHRACAVSCRRCRIRSILVQEHPLVR